MRKKNDTVRFTDKQIQEKIENGEDQTDWAKVDMVVGDRLEASIQVEREEVGAEPDWTHYVLGVPPPKDHINIRIDHDVLQWFKSNGRGYQTHINNVLRAFVQSRRQAISRNK